MIRRFEAAGHHVTVLTTTMRGAGVRRDLRFHWDDHVLVGPPRAAGSSSGPTSGRWRAPSTTSAPTLVSLWGTGAMSLGLPTTIVERGAPAVCVVCDDWRDCARRFDAWTRLFVNRPRGRPGGACGAPRAGRPRPRFAVDGAFCSVSRSTLDRAEARTPLRYPTSTVVCSGMDPADFPLTEPRPRPWRWRLLSVGRIGERTGIATVIRALRRLPSTTRLRFHVVDRAVLRHA